MVPVARGTDTWPAALLLRCRSRVFGGAGVEAVHLHDIGNMKRPFAAEDGALRVLLAFAHVLFNHVRSFHDDPLLFAKHSDNPATLAFVCSRSHHNLVAFLYVRSVHGYW